MTTYTANPGDNLTSKVSVLTAGDVLILNDGTYTEANGMYASGKNGVAGFPITIKAANDGKAIIDGTNMTDSTRRGLVDFDNCTYFNLLGFHARSAKYGSVIQCDNVDYFYLSRLTAHDDGPGNWNAIGFGYCNGKANPNHNVCEDCVAWHGRYCFQSFESGGTTFRRCYAFSPSAYSVGFIAPRAGYSTYNESGTTFENCIIDGAYPVAGSEDAQTGNPMDGWWCTTADVANYPNNNSTLRGCIVRNVWEYAVIHQNNLGTGHVVDNCYVENPTPPGTILSPDGVALGGGMGPNANPRVSYTNCTIVNCSSFGYDGAGAANPVSNSVFEGNNQAVRGSITSTNNNYHGNITNGVALSGTDTAIDPAWNVATYGSGARLKKSSALGGNKGCEILYQTVNGVVTSTPLWPWPMEDRIFAETGKSPTWAANGGLWKTLSGIYGAAPSPSGNNTFNPVAIPITDTEIKNAYRGQYQWYGYAVQPSGWPFVDSYTRYWWFELEPTQGNYDFSKIDAELANAEARGGTFGFRFMALSTGDPGLQSGGVRYFVPSAMWGNTTNYVVDGNTYGVPNWNTDAYLTRLEAMMSALANHITSKGVALKNDPRLGHIDMSGYGNWGEFHDYPYSTTPTLTNASADRIINANVNNFPDCYISIPTSHTYALQHAITVGNGMVGVRVDMIGDTGMGGGVDYLNQAGAIALDAWKKAPFWGEWAAWDMSTHSNMFSVGLQQDVSYHVAQISSGNYSPTSITSWPAQSQTDYQNAMKNAGYRVQISQARIGALNPGSSSTWSVDWQNVLNTPPYGHKQVWYQLRTPGTNTVVWEAASAFALTSWKGTIGLLPTGTGVVTSNDSLLLPANIPAGTYDAAIIVKELRGIYAPMYLAIRNTRASDGAYILGSVLVGPAAPPPPPPSDTYGADVIVDTPIAYWRFDETTGTVFADTTGNGHNGSILAGVTLNQTGVIPSHPSARFDAANAQAGLNLSSYSVISLEFWLNWDVYANDDKLAFEFSGPTNHFDQSNGFLIDPNSGTEVGKFEVSMGATSGTRTAGGSFARPPAGGFHHYVVVLDRVTPNIKVYVDKVLQSFTLSASGATPGAFGNNTLFFMSRQGAQIFGAGFLDEVAVYGYELSAVRVAKHFDDAAPGDIIPPVITNDVFTVTGVSTADANWDTDENSTSNIQWDIVDNRWNNSFPVPADTALVTTHVVHITGLPTGTRIYARVVSTDLAGNIGFGPSRNFVTQTPDTTPPVVSQFNIVTTQTTADPTWNTDELATTEYDFGTSDNPYSSSILVSASLTFTHSAHLTGLAPGTIYHINPRGKDAAGNMSVQQDHLFATQGIVPSSFTVSPQSYVATGQEQVLVVVGTNTSWNTSTTVTVTGAGNPTSRVLSVDSPTRMTIGVTAPSTIDEILSITIDTVSAIVQVYRQNVEPVSYTHQGERYGIGKYMIESLMPYEPGFQDSDLINMFMMAFGHELDMLLRLVNIPSDEMWQRVRDGTLNFELESILSKWVIQTSNGSGLSMYEEFYGLPTDILKSTASRRSNILNRKNSRSISPTVQYILNIVLGFVEAATIVDENAVGARDNSFTVLIEKPYGLPPNDAQMRQALDTYKPAYLGYTIVYSEEDWVALQDRDFVTIADKDWRNFRF